MVQGSMSWVKYLMFVFNFLFLVAGITLIAIGAVVQTTGQPYTEFLGSKFLTGPIIVIIVGVFIFLLSFLGCYGAVKENYCMVSTFGAILFILFVIQIAGGITAYVYRNDVEKFIHKNMMESLVQQKEDGQKLWDETQSKLKCCGVDGVKDYVNHTIKVPDSCCKPEPEPNCTVENAYPKGCFKALVDMAKTNIAKVGGVAIGVCIVELLGVIFAWCLASAIKKEYEGV